MGQKYLIDTNVVIELLSATLPDDSINFLEMLIQENAHYLSVINRIELLSYKGSSEELELLHAFIKTAGAYSLIEDVVDATIEIRKNFNIKLPDAIIAATALINNCLLITRNEKDFAKIKQLKIINPYNL